MEINYWAIEPPLYLKYVRATIMEYNILGEVNLVTILDSWWPGFASKNLKSKIHCVLCVGQGQRVWFAYPRHLHLDGSQAYVINRNCMSQKARDMYLFYSLTLKFSLLTFNSRNYIMFIYNTVSVILFTNSIIVSHISNIARCVSHCKHFVWYLWTSYHDWGSLLKVCTVIVLFSMLCNCEMY